MARKPVNEVSALQTRDALWNAIRTLRDEFTVRDLHLETRSNIDQAGTYVRNLTAAGILEVVNEAEGTGYIKGVKVYRLIKDMGAEAPRVRRDGSLVLMGRGQEQMWETMRSLTCFTLADLQINASTDDCPVSIDTVRTYCNTLARAGYLVRTGKNYTLVKRTGPKPPMIQRTKQVYDPNLKQVMWRELANDTE